MPLVATKSAGTQTTTVATNTNSKQTSAVAMQTSETFDTQTTDDDESIPDEVMPDLELFQNDEFLPEIDEFMLESSSLQPKIDKNMSAAESKYQQQSTIDEVIPPAELSSERPFKCSLCKYSTIRSTNLTRHLKTCSINHEKRFGCKGCGKRCLLYTSPSPRDATLSRMPSSA